VFRGHQPAFLRSWIRGQDEQPHGLPAEYAAGEPLHTYISHNILCVRVPTK
jgi:hypothetical protein